MSNGKGDTPRPLSVDQETFASNWDRVFSNTDDTCEYSGLPALATYQEIQKDVIELTEKVSYLMELNSGMFFERYPQLTGDWDTDKNEWIMMKFTEIKSKEKHNA